MTVSVPEKEISAFIIKRGEKYVAVQEGEIEEYEDRNPGGYN